MNNEALRETITRLMASANALTAIGVALEARVAGSPLPAFLEPHSDELLEVLGVREAVLGATVAELKPLLAEIRSFALQNIKLLSEVPRSDGWAHEEPELLQATGDISVAFPHLMKKAIIPRLSGLAERLDGPDGVVLDVGVGVASMAIEMTRLWPSLRVVGIDRWAPSLSLARENVGAAKLGARIELREQAAEELVDRDVFDLAWIAGAFISETTIPVVFERVHRALRPGGWLLFGMLKPGGEPLAAAVVRFRTALWGGCLLSPSQVEMLLAGTGFVEVATLPSPPSSLAAMIAARKALAPDGSVDPT